MHPHTRLTVAACLAAGLLGVRAQSDGAASAARSEFRAHLSLCAPAVLIEICTNSVADRLDPALCDAVRGLISNDPARRSAGEQGLGAAGLESGMALLMLKLGDRAAGGAAIRWMASNATAVSVGLLLDSYDRTVSGFSRGVVSDDMDESLSMVRTNSLAALRQIYGAELARGQGIDLGNSSSGLVALAIVQYSREQWAAFKTAGLPDRRWEMERARLFELLAARAGKSD